MNKGKLLTIAIPCYNSESYMRNCIETLLPGGEDVEILIVDDGSEKDRTAEIADAYALKYPGMIRVIHQENKGHGGAVNTGIANASGLFFKVVDSDDWVDASAYTRLLEALYALRESDPDVDVVFTNYVYEKEGAKHKRVMKYDRFFPEGEIFGWDRMAHLGSAHYVLMHSLTYRTELLRQSGMKLPEHTFYVDNLYAYKPFAFVKKMYYVNVNLYRYYIGREGQSVNESTMIRRIDQQIRVNEEMIDYLKEIRGLRGRQRDFMIHDVQIITVISSILLIRKGGKESLQRKDELWKRIRKTDPGAYMMIRRSPMGIMLHVPGAPGRQACVLGYRIANRLYGFN